MKSKIKFRKMVIRNWIYIIKEEIKVCGLINTIKWRLGIIPD